MPLDTFTNFATQVQEQGNFDVSPARAGEWVNEVHQRVLAESKFVVKEMVLGTTVAAQAEYDLDTGVVDVELLWLEESDGPVPYDPASVRQIMDLRGGYASLAGTGGVVARDFSSSGTPQIRLYPAPETADVDIKGFVAVVPDELEDDDPLLVPVQLRGDMLDAVIALGMRRMEQRHDLAATFEAKEQALIVKLRLLKNARGVGARAQLQVKGRHW